MRQIVITALLCAIGTLASAQEATHGMDHGAMHGSETASNPFEAVTQKMHEEMNVPPSGNVDVDFARGMIAHHQGAIDMAKIELEKGSDPDMRALAESVIAAQEKEIAEMKEWLADNGG